MNQLIRTIGELGLENFVYYFFLLLGAAAVILLVLKLRKRYGLSVKQSVSEVLITLFVGVLWVMLLSWIENGFSNFGSMDIARGFIFVPLIALIPSKLLNIRKEILWELDALSLVLLQSVSHLGCTFEGCCHGYPCSFGVWNLRCREFLFPVQLLECLTAAAIFAVCFKFLKSQGFRGTGKVYPLMLVLFGSTRFFLEFLRDNPKIIGRISVLAMHAAAMFAAGIVWLCYIWENEAKAALNKKKNNKRTA